MIIDKTQEEAGMAYQFLYPAAKAKKSQSAIKEIGEIKSLNPLNSRPTIKTCEFVSPAHPDKLCDRIADAILDAYLVQDPDSRVAIEVLGGHRVINISGEVTSQVEINIPMLVQEIVGPNYETKVRLVRQSPEIARGLEEGGAGDQGIMIGYACSDTENFMPLEYELARQLCQAVYKRFPFDGKVQVTIKDRQVETVVVSFQNAKRAELEKLVKDQIKASVYLINPAGDWFLGGLEADSGLSGRKLVVDAYGPNVPIGGGSFSGKDYTKVDRSGAYMARHMAIDLLKERGASEVLVKLAYAIGVSEPVMAVAVIDGKEEDLQVSCPGRYDLSPRGIRETLGLNKFKFSDLASWGHFGRREEF